MVDFVQQNQLKYNISILSVHTRVHWTRILYILFIFSVFSCGLAISGVPIIFLENPTTELPTTLESTEATV